MVQKIAVSGRLRELIPGLGLYVPPRVPMLYCQKACHQVRRFRRGERNYIRLKEKGTGYLKINISLSWRLLSRDAGQHWELMHHERYNNEIRKA
ncbi:hypothetical protein [Xenorhabdus bovienii]|uniref:ParE family toxin-like protein n=1 Tax=Xenorhabdus bovienii TaxID=40576 RepID=UPI0023B23D93|nr:hypothetical protein [Xenorhabdus bovienii]MDE9535879.1 hypothetical protein [Xenorhabdus bovienii]MDE9588772.1 hypothetical protein [Xenorhabdus bovienii]